MANGSVTTTGLQEMRTKVRAFPPRVTATLRSVAWRASRRVMAVAQQRLRSSVRHPQAPRTADFIHVEEQPDRKQFLVKSIAPPGEWANLPLGLEFGTRKMEAQPYMGPAADAEREPYRREMEAASAAVAQETFA